MEWKTLCKWNERGCVPVKLYLWALKFEFRVVFPSHEIHLFWRDCQRFTNVKAFLSLQGVLRQVAGQIWPSGCGKKVKVLSCVRLFATPWTVQSMDSPDQNTGVGSLSLLQGIFPTQGLNPGHPHCRRILYQLSHQGSPRILEWVASPFPSGSSWLRNWLWNSI